MSLNSFFQGRKQIVQRVTLRMSPGDKKLGSTYVIQPSREAEIKEDQGWRPGQWNSSIEPIFKTAIPKWTAGVAQVLALQAGNHKFNCSHNKIWDTTAVKMIEYLHNQHEVLTKKQHCHKNIQMMIIKYTYSFKTFPSGSTISTAF
jgi:hypothetical protein